MIEFKDGQKMAQSVAITRMLARQHGYYPVEPMEAFECDYLVDIWLDVLTECQKVHFMKEGSAERQTQIEKVFNIIVPVFLGKLQPYLSRRKFLMGDRIYLCDFWIGMLYVNFFKKRGIYEQQRWDALLQRYPDFEAYGELFSKENKQFLASRTLWDK